MISSTNAQVFSKANFVCRPCVTVRARRLAWEYRRRLIKHLKADPPQRHRRDRNDSWRVKSRDDDHAERAGQVSGTPPSSDEASATAKTLSSKGRSNLNAD